MSEPSRKAGPKTGPPTWAKVFGIITLVVVVVVLVVVVTGRGGPHSPRRHISPGETTAGRTGGQTRPPPRVTLKEP